VKVNLGFQQGGQGSQTFPGEHFLICSTKLLENSIRIILKSTPLAKLTL